MVGWHSNVRTAHGLPVQENIKCNVVHRHHSAASVGYHALYAVALPLYHILQGGYLRLHEQVQYLCGLRYILTVNHQFLLKLLKAETNKLTVNIQYVLVKVKAIAFLFSLSDETAACNRMECT
eukprot:IDg19453t1